MSASSEKNKKNLILIISIALDIHIYLIDKVWVDVIKEREQETHV